jgi:hypothetical protein
VSLTIKPIILKNIKKPNIKYIYIYKEKEKKKRKQRGVVKKFLCSSRLQRDDGQASSLLNHCCIIQRSMVPI